MLGRCKPALLLKNKRLVAVKILANTFHISERLRQYSCFHLGADFKQWAAPKAKPPCDIGTVVRAAREGFTCLHAVLVQRVQTTHLVSESPGP